VVLTTSGTSESSSGILCLILITCCQVKRALYWKRYRDWLLEWLRKWRFWSVRDTERVCLVWAGKTKHEGGCSSWKWV